MQRSHLDSQAAAVGQQPAFADMAPQPRPAPAGTQYKPREQLTYQMLQLYFISVK